MIYLTKRKAFSRKNNTKRIKYKYHDIKFLFFMSHQMHNDIGLIMNIDDRNLHIPLTLDEAENLLKDLTESIEKIKSQNQSA